MTVNLWLEQIADRTGGTRGFGNAWFKRLEEWARHEARDEEKIRVSDALLEAIGEDEEDFSWYAGWSAAECTPADQPERGIAVANWNSYPVPEGTLEALGFECAWDDAVDECACCNRPVMTQPQFYGWRPRFWRDDEHQVVCYACLDEHEGEREAMIEQLRGRASNARVVPHARYLPDTYVRVDFAGAHGFYGGQADDPRAVGRFLEDRGVHDYLFNITDIGQFDCHFEVWVNREQENVTYGVAIDEGSWRRRRVFLSDAAGDVALFPSEADARMAGDHPTGGLAWPDDVRGTVEVFAVFPGLARAAKGADPAEMIRWALRHASRHATTPPPGTVTYTQLHMDGTSTTRHIDTETFIRDGVK
jgi:hypothetical protein